jgi:hypothetical protein
MADPTRTLLPALIADQARTPLTRVFVAGRHVTVLPCVPIPTPEHLRDIRTALRNFLRAVRLFLPVIDGPDSASEMEPVTRVFGLAKVKISAFALQDALNPFRSHDAECCYDLVVVLDFLMRSFCQVMGRWSYDPEPVLRLGADWRWSDDGPFPSRVAQGIYPKELLALEQASDLLDVHESSCGPGCPCGPDPRGHNDPPRAADRGPDPLVTLRQAAAAVGRSKRTLEKLKARGMPRPAALGGRGRAALWRWSELRPWLADYFHVAVPDDPPVRRTPAG